MSSRTSTSPTSSISAATLTQPSAALCSFCAKPRPARDRLSGLRTQMWQQSSSPGVMLGRRSLALMRRCSRPRRLCVPISLRRWPRFLGRPGGLDFVWHSLRHGGASRALMLGADVQDIMIRGRWRCLESTRRYLQAGRHLLMSIALPPPCSRSLSGLSGPEATLSSSARLSGSFGHHRATEKALCASCCAARLAGFRVPAEPSQRSGHGFSASAWLPCGDG